MSTYSPPPEQQFLIDRLRWLADNPDHWEGAHYLNVTRHSFQAFSAHQLEVFDDHTHEGKDCRTEAHTTTPFGEFLFIGQVAWGAHYCRDTCHDEPAIGGMCRRCREADDITHTASEDDIRGYAS